MTLFAKDLRPETENPASVTHCPFCGVQCALIPAAGAAAGESGMRAVKGHSVAGGKVCQKGLLTDAPSMDQGRICEALLRTEGGFVKLTTDGALDWAAAAIGRLQKRWGKTAMAVYGSGALINEEAYLLGKFARVALGTPHIDYNGRYCMSSAAAAMNAAFGLDRGLPFPASDIGEADFILLLGTNLAECQPTLAQYLVQARRRGGALAVVDPRRTRTADMADHHVAVAPGGDLWLMKGLLKIAVEEGLVDRDYIAAHTSGFAHVEEEVRALPLEWLAARCDVPVRRMRMLARRMAAAPRAMILTARGVEQQARGVETVLACIHLALALGKVGRPGSGYGSLTGQANGQGGREMGQKCDQLPGYRSIEDEHDRKVVSAVWGVAPERLPRSGASAFKMFEKIHAGEIRGLVVVGANPSASSPDRGYVRAALRKLELLIVVELVPTETSALAHVVLPGSVFREKTGTVTNLEGRVLLKRAIASAPPGILPEWQLIARLAARLGYADQFAYGSEREVFDELRRTTRGARADYWGVTYERLAGEPALHWPCPDEWSPGTPRMFTRRFAHADGRARFAQPVAPAAVGPDGGQEAESPGGPGPTRRSQEGDTGARRPGDLTLVTGRTGPHYNTGSTTRRMAALNARAPAVYVEMHPETAACLGVAGGDMASLCNATGEKRFAVRLTDRIRRDTVFVPFHWEGEAAVNDIVPAVLDPHSGMPAFKYAQVTVAAVASREAPQRADGEGPGAADVSGPDNSTEVIAAWRE